MDDATVAGVQSDRKALEKPPLKRLTRQPLWCEMEAMSWQTVLLFIPPTIAISVLAYFVRFFGKAITDQTPYADNRDWSIELTGIWFFVDFLFPPAIVAGGLLVYFKTPIMVWYGGVSGMFAPVSYHWLDLIIIFIGWLYCVLASTTLTQERYKLPNVLPDSEDPAVFNEKRKRRFDLAMKANAVLLQPLVLLVSFIVGVEIFSGSVLWITIFAVQSFAVLVGVALNYSLARQRFPRVNLHFVNEKGPLQDVLLLKLNPDNARVRDGGRVLVINRSILSEIEFVDVQQKPEISRPLIPFATWIPWLLALDAFWWHRFLIGILVGFILPLVVFGIAAAFAANSPEARKVAAQQLGINDPGEEPKNIDAAVKSLPTPTTIALIGCVTGSTARKSLLSVIFAIA
jgi:hypothetical protein